MTFNLYLYSLFMNIQTVCAFAIILSVIGIAISIDIGDEIYHRIGMHKRVQHVTLLIFIIVSSLAISVVTPSQVISRAVIEKIVGESL